MKKIKWLLFFVLVAVLVLSILVLSGCDDSKSFMEMKIINHVKVEKIKTRMIGKESHTEVIYQKNNKQYDKIFEQNEDRGLRDYYHLAETFNKENFYLDLVVNKHGRIIVAVLSGVEKTYGKK